MIKYRESRISAHHNYLVNNMLTPGFVAGDPNSRKDFYFLADLVFSGESTPRISARLLDEKGGSLLELNWNRICVNSGECTHQSIAGGFQILLASGEPLLEVCTQSFAKGYLTRIKARLFDETGNLRMEPMGEGIQVHGEVKLALESPFVFSPTSP
jgi:hypothetical protein